MLTLYVWGARIYLCLIWIYSATYMLLFLIIISSLSLLNSHSSMLPPSTKVFTYMHSYVTPCICGLHIFMYVRMLINGLPCDSPTQAKHFGQLRDMSNTGGWPLLLFLCVPEMSAFWTAFSCQQQTARSLSELRSPKTALCHARESWESHHRYVNILPNEQVPCRSSEKSRHHSAISTSKQSEKAGIRDRCWKLTLTWQFSRGWNCTQEMKPVIGFLQKHAFELLSGANYLTRFETVREKSFSGGQNHVELFWGRPCEGGKCKNLSTCRVWDASQCHWLSLSGRMITK